MTPNYQQLRRDLGKTASTILLQAERGTLFEYIERAKVPTLEKRRRIEWHDAYKTPFPKAMTDAELYATDNMPSVMYEIMVNGEFYGVTRRLDNKYLNEMYPYLRYALRTEEVDIYSQETKELIISNHIKLQEDETE